MQKVIGVFIITFIIISTILPPIGNVTAEERINENLMQNGGFETIINNSSWTNSKGPEKWNIWVPSGNPELSIDSDVYHEGGKSISIHSLETSRADILQDVSVKPGYNYQLSFWVKTENIEASSGGVFVRTQYLDSSSKKVSDGPSTEKIKGSQDWNSKKLNLTIPASASKVRIELFFETAKGKTWFDEVKLEESGKGIMNFRLKQNAVSLGIGETLALTPVFTPDDVADKTVTWISSNPEIAFVNDNGIITGVDSGVTTIKATSKDGGFTAECLVSVDSIEDIGFYDELRFSWFNKLTGNELYNPANQDAADYISNLVDKVTDENGTGIWDLMNKAENRNSLWTDNASTTNSAQITTSYQRLKDMALVYSSKGSTFFHNQALKADIISGLEWLKNNRYNETKDEYGNWWDWEIGIPQTLNDIIVLMYNDLSSTQINNYIKAIDRFVPDPTKRVSLSDSNFRETGANLLDKALVVSLRGIIEKNSGKVLQGRDSISKEYIYVNSGDGVYRDGSLVQHFNIAYTGGYGATWLGRTADMLYLLRDSPWEVKDQNVSNVFNWVSNSFEPLIYKGAMMDMVSGRGVSRQSTNDHATGRSIILSLLRLADAAPSDDALAIKRMVKEWIQTDTTFNNYVNGLSIYQINLVSALMSDTSIEARGELVKNQVFAGMDRVVHLRPGFGFGISMFSDRISGFEYGNGENKKGWYTGAGATYLYNNDLKQFSNDFWPTVDSYRLPGTTTDQSKGILKDWDSYYNPKSWVGGSNFEGLYGTAGMDFSLEKLTGSSLKGKKSWFMFDDEIVALGTDISSNAEPEVETIIENRQLNDRGDNKLIINGEERLNELGDSETLNDVKWAHLEKNAHGSDIGYYFPNSPSLYGLRESRTGSWNEINNGGSTQSITRNYLSLAFNHGKQPVNASYSYVLLPNKDVEQTESYNGKPDVTILANTESVQSVREETLKLTAANFYKAETVDFITAGSAASVMVKEENNSLTLSVSDPTQKQEKIVIEMNRAGLDINSEDTTIKVLQTSPTIKVEVNVANSFGKTHSVQFIDKTSPKVTAPKTEDIYRTDSVNLKYELSDSYSHIASDEFYLDDVAVSNPIEIKPYSLSLGDHTIKVTGTDQAGNVIKETYKLKVKMDINHLDEAIYYGMEKKWIKNKGIANNLRSRIKYIQSEKMNNKQIRNELNAMENLVQAQAGRKIDLPFAKLLLEDITSILSLYG
ncbi:polysaccharide lyase family 8 super-sandwich domain-containing protein [Bacillales bacterium AN1005]